MTHFKLSVGTWNTQNDDGEYYKRTEHANRQKRESCQTLVNTTTPASETQVPTVSETEIPENQTSKQIDLLQPDDAATNTTSKTLNSSHREGF